MKLFRHQRLIVFCLLAIFGLTSVMSCAHGPCDDDSDVALHQSESPSASLLLVQPCHDDCGDHAGDSDSHLCPCLCHSPASVETAYKPQLLNLDDFILTTIHDSLSKGYLNAIERPPKTA